MCQMTTTKVFQEIKHQTSTRPDERIIQSCGCIGGSGGQDLRYVNKIPFGAEEAGIYQSFLGLLNYSKNFYLS